MNRTGGPLLVCMVAVLVSAWLNSDIVVVPLHTHALLIRRTTWTDASGHS